MLIESKRGDAEWVSNTFFKEVLISAVDLLFSTHRKCFGMMLNYSIGVPDFYLQRGRIMPYHKLKIVG